MFISKYLAIFFTVMATFACLASGAPSSHEARRWAGTQSLSVYYCSDAYFGQPKCTTDYFVEGECQAVAKGYNDIVSSFMTAPQSASNPRRMKAGAPVATCFIYADFGCPAGAKHLKITGVNGDLDAKGWGNTMSSYRCMYPS